VKFRETRTFDFDGEGGGLAAGLVRDLDLVESGLVRSEVLDLESGVPGVGLDGRLDLAGGQRRPVEEPLGTGVRVSAEVDVNVDARAGATA